MRTFFYILLFVLSYLTSYSQFDIRGTVVFDSIQLEGVNISILNSTRGTITNSKGQFKVHNIEARDTIRFSMMGYKTVDLMFSDKDLGDVKIYMKESIIELSEIAITSSFNVSDIIKKVSDNLQNNYPTRPSFFNAVFRKQISKNANNSFLGNAEISVLCPSYISKGKKKVILNSIKIIKNDAANLIVKIAATSLLDFSPKFGFISSPQYFDFTFMKSIKWENEIYFKIAFKTKQEYWEDSPYTGIITIEKCSYAISEIQWNTYKKEDTSTGYSKERGMYKGTFVTHELSRHFIYSKKDDNKWHFNYSSLIWNFTVDYKKYPSDSYILKSDLYFKENIPLSNITKLKYINMNKDLFRKQKSNNYSQSNDLNPILPDFK